MFIHRLHLASLFALLLALSPLSATARDDGGQLSDQQGVGDLPNVFPQIEVFEPLGWRVERVAAESYNLINESGGAGVMSVLLKTAGVGMDRYSAVLEALCKENSMEIVTTVGTELLSGDRTVRIRCARRSDPPSRWDARRDYYLREVKDGPVLIITGIWNAAEQKFLPDFEKLVDRSNYRASPADPKLAPKGPSTCPQGEFSGSYPQALVPIPTGWHATRNKARRYYLSTLSGMWDVSVTIVDPKEAKMQAVVADIRKELPRGTVVRRSRDRKTGETVVTLRHREVSDAARPFTDALRQAHVRRTKDGWIVVITGTNRLSYMKNHPTFQKDFDRIVEGTSLIVDP